jgi:hypothetical protein
MRRGRGSIRKCASLISGRALYAALGCRAARVRCVRNSRGPGPRSRPPRRSTVSGWPSLRPWRVSRSAAGLLLSGWRAIRGCLWSLAWIPHVRPFTSGTAGQGNCTNSGPLPPTRRSTEMPSAGSGSGGHQLRHGIRTGRCFWWRPRAKWCGGLRPGSPNWKVFRLLPLTAAWRSARMVIPCGHRHRHAPGEDAWE